MAVKKKETTKVEDKRPNKYELVAIINPDVAEEALESTINNISQLITSKGGEVTDTDRWGKKKLAFPINHFGEGNYVLTRFTMNPARSKELEASMFISDEVLRHLLIRLND